MMFVEKAETLGKSGISGFQIGEDVHHHQAEMISTAHV
jgi:hypothetical protein